MEDAWWTAFGDADLNAQMVEALGQNFSVRAAFARLEASREVVRQARAPMFPTVEATAGTGVTSDQVRGDATYEPVELGASVSYEIDLWGRIRSQTQAAAYRAEASAADAEAAALSLSGEVANTWLALAAVQEQLDLLDEQIRANVGMAEVVEARFLNGVVRLADSLRQERLLEATRAQRVQRLAEHEVLQHQLAVLLGRPPKDVPTSLPNQLPALPPLPDAGVPLDLVRRRPDLKAAEQNLRATDADVATAIANQFPRLTLDASFTWAPAGPQAMVTSWLASLGANVLAPIFEGGRRRAQVRQARALAEAQLAEYGGALLTSLQEVEDALTRNRRQAELVANLERQVDLAARTAVGLQDQYTGGLDVGYLDVLTAQTSAQQLRREAIVARQRHLELRVDLFLALAGGLIPAGEEDPP